MTASPLPWRLEIAAACTKISDCVSSTILDKRLIQMTRKKQLVCDLDRCALHLWALLLLVSLGVGERMIRMTRMIVMTRLHGWALLPLVSLELVRYHHGFERKASLVARKRGALTADVFPSNQAA